MNKNAPFIREIIARSQPVGGVRVTGKNQEEAKQNALSILKQQLKATDNARTQTH